MSLKPEEIQREYYRRTASAYEQMHMQDTHDEHYLALEMIDMMCDRHRWTKLLDVGAGTGRGVRFLSQRGKDVMGVEPVSALIDVAVSRGCPAGTIIEGSGYQLPFEDNAFDVVFECGVLHHVAEPSRVVREMMRVSSAAIFISDANRFGQGSHLSRWIKLMLYKIKIWPLVRYMQTGGKMYTISEGDGLGYSYSVFDSLELVADWATLTFLVPTGPVKRTRMGTWLHPLITSPSVLLCAVKKQ